MCVFNITASCPAVCLGLGNSVWVCVHIAHFCLIVDSYLLLPQSVKDRGDLGGKERGT